MNHQIRVGDDKSIGLHGSDKDALASLRPIQLLARCQIPRRGAVLMVRGENLRKKSE
jgi:hypothetical protein